MRKETLYIYIHNSKPLDVVQSLYFGSKLPSPEYIYIYCLCWLRYI